MRIDMLRARAMACRANLLVARGALLIRRPLRWFESVSQLIAANIQSAGRCVIFENYSVLLHQVGTQLAPARGKTAFGGLFTHCIAHVRLYVADNFFETTEPDAF